MHRFEDLFSSERTVRIDSDNDEKMRQVKSPFRLYNVAPVLGFSDAPDPELPDSW